jgi:NADH dehydrogenase
MLRQIGCRLRGKPLGPYTYRDFGSLVSLGRYSTVGNLMGIVGRNIFIEGLFARLIYKSLHLMHERALRGMPRTILDLLARRLSRATGPRVKLH